MQDTTFWTTKELKDISSLYIGMSVCWHGIAGTPTNARGKLLQEENFGRFSLAKHLRWTCEAAKDKRKKTNKLPYKSKRQKVLKAFTKSIIPQWFSKQLFLQDETMTADTLVCVSHTQLVSKRRHGTTSKTNFGSKKTCLWLQDTYLWLQDNTTCFADILILKYEFQTHVNDLQLKHR